MEPKWKYLSSQDLRVHGQPFAEPQDFWQDANFKCTRIDIWRAIEEIAYRGIRNEVMDACANSTRT